jgi:two-component system LytT family response regulator
MKAIIIEDEFSSREYLKNTLKQYFKELEIVAECDNVPESIIKIFEHRPDIVYLDIEIKLGTGFDVLAKVQEVPFTVIFTTAFDTFAVNAFRHHAVDYLLKPLQKSQVIEATELAILKTETKRDHENLNKVLQQLQRPALSRFPINTMYGIEFIDTEEILYAEADSNYCRLKLTSGRSITITKKIKEVAEQLPEPAFIRIHQSSLVHTRYIRKYEKGRGGQVILDDGTSLPVSPSRKDDFLKLFT